MPSDLSIVEMFRPAHHNLARMIASGCSHEFIESELGMSKRRILLVENNPAFQNLVALYACELKKAVAEVTDEYKKTLRANMMLSEVLIAEKLDAAIDDPDKVSLNTLNKVSIDRAERLGYSKTAKVDVNFNFTSSLDRAIERSRSRMIEGTAVESSPPLKEVRELSSSPRTSASSVGLEHEPGSRHVPKHLREENPRDRSLASPPRSPITGDLARRKIA